MNPNTSVSDPLNIINKEIPLPGENPHGGVRVIDFNQNTACYKAQYIYWNTGKRISSAVTEMTPSYILDRFNLNNTRKTQTKPKQNKP